MNHPQSGTIRYFDVLIILASSKEMFFDEASCSFYDIIRMSRK
jgi:hypothetical protein